MSGHILTKWRGRVRAWTACREAPAYGLRDVCRVGGPWSHFWKPHRTCIGAPHCARPKKNDKRTQRMSHRDTSLSIKSEINNKYTLSKASRKKNKEIVGCCVDCSFYKLHINKKARVGRGAAVLWKAFSITMPSLQWVNFHLNINSSALASADGADVTASALLSLVQNTKNVSHALHQLWKETVFAFLCFVSDTIIFHSSLPLNAQQQECVSIINFPFNIKNKDDSSCSKELLIKTSLQCYQSVTKT